VTTELPHEAKPKSETKDFVTYNQIQQTASYLSHRPTASSTS